MVRIVMLHLWDNLVGRHVVCVNVLNRFEDAFSAAAATVRESQRSHLSFILRVLVAVAVELLLRIVWPLG